jgi:uncharacterized protein YxjI
MKINGEEVARVKKNIMAFTDKYLIDVTNTDYADLALISTVIFDALYNSSNQGRRR